MCYWYKVVSLLDVYYVVIIYENVLYIIVFVVEKIKYKKDDENEKLSIYICYWYISLYCNSCFLELGKFWDIGMRISIIDIFFYMYILFEFIVFSL